MELLDLLLTFTFLTSRLLLYECRQLNEYAFPVYTTEFCPRNESEWKARSSEFNCTKDYSYACFPNNEITELIEFCYDLPIIAIPKGGCLFLNKRNSKTDWYDCTSFTSGCPDEPYRGSYIYKYPKCVEIENGCFLAAPSCQSASKTTTQETNTEETTTQETTVLDQKKDNSSFRSTAQERKINNIIVYSFGILLPPCIIGCLIVVLYVKRKQLIREKDISTFECWEREDKFFRPTLQSEQVERMMNTGNIVTVVGFFETGKSAIIQHIGLKNREDGWLVIPVDTLNEILEISEEEKFVEGRTLFVLNDPIGKWKINEASYSYWRSHEKTLQRFLQDHNLKLLLSCRMSILKDAEVEKLEHFHNVIQVDERSNKLTENENENRHRIRSNTTPVKCSRYMNK